MHVVIDVGWILPLGLLQPIDLKLFFNLLLDVHLGFVVDAVLQVAAVELLDFFTMLARHWRLLLRWHLLHVLGLLVGHCSLVCKVMAGNSRVHFVVRNSHALVHRLVDEVAVVPILAALKPMVIFARVCLRAGLPRLRSRRLLNRLRVSDFRLLA